MIDYLEALFPAEDEEQEEILLFGTERRRVRGAAAPTERGGVVAEEADLALGNMAQTDQTVGTRQRSAGFDAPAAVLGAKTGNDFSSDLQLRGTAQAARRIRAVGARAVEDDEGESGADTWTAEIGTTGRRWVFPDVRGARGRAALAVEMLEAMAQDGGVKAAARLYGRVRETGAAAEYVRRGAAVLPTSPPVKQQWAAGVTSGELDRLCERDARRYAGTFEFY